MPPSANSAKKLAEIASKEQADAVGYEGVARRYSVRMACVVFWSNRGDRAPATVLRGEAVPAKVGESAPRHPRLRAASICQNRTWKKPVVNFS